MKILKDEIICKMLASDKTRTRGFEMMVHEYSESLYWKIRRMVITHEDANDILQNTFLKAWNSLSAFKKKSKLNTWLYSIAINEALDHLRKQRKVTEMTTDNLNLAQMLMSDNYFDGNEAQAKLIEAISILPDVQRTVFNLRYFDNMKYSEISQILKTTEGALKASYHIAVKKITDYLKLEQL